MNLNIQNINRIIEEIDNSNKPDINEVIAKYTFNDLENTLLENITLEQDLLLKYIAHINNDSEKNFKILFDLILLFIDTKMDNYNGSSIIYNLIYNSFKQNKDHKYSHKLYKRYKEKMMFMFPSIAAGGMPILFFNLAKLYIDMGFKVYYSDYHKGYIRGGNKLAKGTIKFLDFNRKKNNDYTNLGDILYINNSFHNYIYNNVKISKESTIFSWVLHTHNFVTNYNLLNNEYSLTKKNYFNIFLNHNSKNAYGYIDESAYLETKDFFKKNLHNLNKKIKLLENYVQVPTLTPSQNNIKQNVVSTNEINISWLGRLDSDKINSVINLLDNFDNYETNKKKIIHIIGTNTEEQLDNTRHNSSLLIKKEDYPTLEIKLLGAMFGKKLEKYLSKNIDISFAMGTSLLNTAILKIPTVLVPVDIYKKIIVNNYLWFFDTNKYTMGYSEKQTKLLESYNFTTIDTLFDDFYSKDNNKVLYGEKCYNKVKKHHSYEETAIKLLIAANNSTLTFKDYQDSSPQIKLEQKSGRQYYRLYIKIIIYLLFLFLARYKLIPSKYKGKEKIAKQKIHNNIRWL